MTAAGAGRQLLDLHNHTRHSYDAQNRAADYERAHAAGLVGLVAITDHNTIAGALELREPVSFPVIVGQEIPRGSRPWRPPRGSATRAASSTSSIRSAASSAGGCAPPPARSCAAAA